MNASIPGIQLKRHAPLTNAERQARWRAKHRPAKPHLQFGPNGVWYDPHALMQPAAVAQPTPPPQPTQPTPAGMHRCPHCNCLSPISTSR